MGFQRLFGVVRIRILLFVTILMLAGCVSPPADDLPSEAVQKEQDEVVQVSTPTATLTALPSPTSTSIPPSPTALPPTPTSTPTEIPEAQAVNPLTGQPVQDPATLCQRPLLVSVSNFPVSSRPQAGLSAAAQVWETFIGEGMTRLLTVFYGDYIRDLEEIINNRLAEGSEEGFVIGPVRSGRVVYEDIKTLFEGGRLITAGASSDVAAQLTGRSSVYSSNPDDINSAGVGVGDLVGDPGCQVDPSQYTTLIFDPVPPSGGEDAPFVRIVYNYLNQIGWEYDPEQDVYLRSQDKADGTGELFPAIDRLTGEQLAFENVVVMWAQHRFVTPTIIEMELVYVWDQKGLLFRDGKVYDIKWSTRKGELVIHDADGTPIPLKPGRTFFEVVSWQSTWYPQTMIVRYHNPPR
ncbi:MAG: DUF3048 C-terminal domain-containing protein [Anaerolineaceae bacterium]|nr:MAG: DUF3048 C-terminal domain-containing protein [Anaerolineaceae bacterium]